MRKERWYGPAGELGWASRRPGRWAGALGPTRKGGGVVLPIRSGRVHGGGGDRRRLERRGGEGMQARRALLWPEWGDPGSGIPDPANTEGEEAGNGVSDG